LREDVASSQDKGDSSAEEAALRNASDLISLRVRDVYHVDGWVKEVGL
jgi:hypothetical protein